MKLKPIFETIGRFGLLIFLSIVYYGLIYEDITQLGYWIMQILGFIMVMWAMLPVFFANSTDAEGVKEE